MPQTLEEAMKSAMATADAMVFAAEKHKDQKRKYTGEPYITHCAQVAGILSGIDPVARTITEVEHVQFRIFEPME